MKREVSPDWLRIFTLVDGDLDDAFRQFKERIPDDRPYWVYRSRDTRYVVRLTKLAAINQSPDGRVWLFKRSNSKPYQILGNRNRK